jgi:hypothetical protein
LAAFFRDPGVAKIELDIGRIVHDLRVEARKIVRGGDDRRREQEEYRQGK